MPAELSKAIHPFCCQTVVSQDKKPEIKTPARVAQDAIGNKGILTEITCSASSSRHIKKAKAYTKQPTSVIPCDNSVFHQGTERSNANVPSASPYLKKLRRFEVYLVTSKLSAGVC